MPFIITYDYILPNQGYKARFAGAFESLTHFSKFKKVEAEMPGRHDLEVIIHQLKWISPSEYKEIKANVQGS